MKNAICIGCGCDEMRGCNASLCPIAGQHSCFWLHFDADARVGLCSECGDLDKAWKEGQRTPFWPLIAERFYRQVMFIYENHASAIAWMMSPQRIFGDRTPRELILEERIEDLQTALDDYRVGVFS